MAPPSRAALLIGLLILPGSAAAQSISSSGALGDNLLAIVPLVLMGVLGLPAIVAYFILGRIRLSRWPSAWGAILPLLAAPVLGLTGVFMALDMAPMPVYFGIPILGEMALVWVMIAIARWRQGRAQAA
ncbi:MAG: hypothetical protein ACI8RZ_000591 [Myxococcota bacterium]|jgi:hypothetical protein